MSILTPLDRDSDNVIRNGAVIFGTAWKGIFGNSESMESRVVWEKTHNKSFKRDGQTCCLFPDTA